MKNNTIEKTVFSINELLERKKENEDLYIQDELRSLISDIFKSPKDAAEFFSKEVKSTLKKIICMDKSTGAYSLYKYLKESDFSFSEGLLMYAIDNEPYYNNNDSAFVYYLLKAVHKTELEKSVTLFVNQTLLLEGHFWDYKEIFINSYELHRKNLIPQIPQNIEREIIHSVSTGQHHHRKMKAIATSVFLGIQGATPHILNTFLSKVREVIKMKEQGEIKVNYNINNSVQNLGFVLYCLTNEEKYKELSICPTDGLFDGDDVRIPIFNTIYETIKKYNY
ncbi:MAG: hypothetical protein NT068_02205 [Candidatus Nomurabacteria bacterium]|nr:hypothetical protein [Candidatus Nomurabacteria bacterium]